MKLSLLLSAQMDTCQTQQKDAVLRHLKPDFMQISDLNVMQWLSISVSGDFFYQQIQYLILQFSLTTLNHLFAYSEMCLYNVTFYTLTSSGFLSLSRCKQDIHTLFTRSGIQQSETDRQTEIFINSLYQSLTRVTVRY